MEQCDLACANWATLLTERYAEHPELRDWIASCERATRLLERADLELPSEAVTSCAIEAKSLETYLDCGFYASADYSIEAANSGLEPSGAEGSPEDQGGIAEPGTATTTGRETRGEPGRSRTREAVAPTEQPREARAPTVDPAQFAGEWTLVSYNGRPAGQRQVLEVRVVGGAGKAERRTYGFVDRVMDRNEYKATVSGDVLKMTQGGGRHEGSTLFEYPWSQHDRAEISKILASGGVAGDEQGGLYPGQWFHWDFYVACLGRLSGEESLEVNCKWSGKGETNETEWIYSRADEPGRTASKAGLTPGGLEVGPKSVAGQSAKATLEIVHVNRLKSVTLAISIGDREVWSGILEGPKNIVKRAAGREERVTAPASPGRHTVTVHLVGGKGKVDVTESIDGRFGQGEVRTLRVILRANRNMRLEWQD